MPAFLSCTSRPNAPGQGNMRFTIIQTAAVRNLLSLHCKNLIMKDWAQLSARTRIYKQQYTVNSPETLFFLAWFQS
ncbi:hypothetical protein NC651_002637 [Populus alba x Populus x berolinensis]|nr:hypothetical protein NC651_002637 [Populus alba x Populus x berolinensis]